MDSTDYTTVIGSNSTVIIANRNNTSSFFGFKSQYTPLEALLTAVTLLAIILVTVVGNVLVCLAVCMVKKLRQPSNYLIVSLAVSDLCVAILVMPLAMLYEILGRWSFGNLMCDLWVSFDVLSCTASILNLCMISVDRYLAITKPLDYGVKRTPKRMILWVALVWLGAACISLPPLLIIGNEHEVIEGVPHCVVCQNFGYQIYATLGSFYIPLTVMITVYYKIFCAARRIVLDERRAQAHLETNRCYLEITAKNGDGPPESRIAVKFPKGSSHRPGTTSTATNYSAVGSLNNNRRGDKSEPPDKMGTLPLRTSNESQCPMLQTTTACQRVKDKFRLKKKNSRGGWGSASGGAAGSSSAATIHAKKLRFQLATERKASTTLGIIMSAFVVCWLPFFVLALVRPFLKDSKAIPSSLSSIFLWLGYANSLLNPVIYATTTRDFRRPFQQILFFRCGSLNHMMREEFYHSQYGDPDPPHHSASPERTTIRDVRPDIGNAAASDGAHFSGGGGAANESFL